jgi:hypothetical protein
LRGMAAVEPLLPVTNRTTKRASVCWSRVTGITIASPPCRELWILSRVTF